MNIKGWPERKPPCDCKVGKCGIKCYFNLGANFMRDECAKAVEGLEANYRTLLKDTCDDEDKIKDLCRPYLTKMEVDGDSFGVPGPVDVVEALVKKVESSHPISTEPYGVKGVSIDYKAAKSANERFEKLKVEATTGGKAAKPSGGEVPTKQQLVNIMKAWSTNMSGYKYKAGSMLHNEDFESVAEDILTKITPAKVTEPGFHIPEYHRLMTVLTGYGINKAKPLADVLWEHFGNKESAAGGLIPLDAESLELEVDHLAQMYNDLEILSVSKVKYIAQGICDKFGRTKESRGLLPLNETALSRFILQQDMAHGDVCPGEELARLICKKFGAVEIICPVCKEERRQETA